jgi:exoribonuclease II
MLQEFSEKNDIPVYFLHEKYSEMEIWRDNIHVAINQDVQIYTNDILEILLKEMSNSAI